MLGCDWQGGIDRLDEAPDARGGSDPDRTNWPFTLTLQMTLLSIIVPFHDSAGKCGRLLSTLATIENAGVELVLVDDGSTDGTALLLKQFERTAKAGARLVFQENRGPGAARNAGCRAASGEYVWFVDSDDDIRAEPVEFLENCGRRGFDFVDFDLLDRGEQRNTMGLPPGEYRNQGEVETLLGTRFGRMCTKLVRKDLIESKTLYFPEYCFYEDNLAEFTYPGAVSTFCKSRIVGYIHHQEFSSITRRPLDGKYFDRLPVAEYGIRRVSIAKTGHIPPMYREKFTTLYLLNTVNQTLGRMPGSHWISLMQLMKSYRKIARNLRLARLQLRAVPGSWKYKAVFTVLWCVSYILPRRSSYFERMHMRAWGRPIQFFE